MTFTQLLLLLLTGLAAGMVSGSLGVGGGIVLVPALIFVMGFTQHQAQGTSLAMMLPPVVIFAAINYYKEGHINIKVALILMVAFTLGAYLGSKFALNISPKILKKAFGTLLIIAALKMIFSK